MAKAKRKGNVGRRATGARRGNGGSRSNAAVRGAKDAITLLKADHREVEGWFSQFEKTSSSARKRELAGKICTALKAHTTIEEESFYPAFLEATDEKDIHHEAEVEHAGAKRLIAEIEAMSADDDYYDAKVTVLSEMIKHHVKEEEKPGGMFAKARASEMDLERIGAHMQARKKELLGKARSRERAEDVLTPAPVY